MKNLPDIRQVFHISALFLAPAKEIKELMKNIERKYYLLATVIFLFAVVLGLIFGQNSTAFSNTIGENAPFINYLGQLPLFMLFLAIFFNNAIKSFFVIVLGTFFGIVPIYFTYVNGTILGIVFAYAGMHSKLPVAFAGILPHGVFELPALIISIAYGLWLGAAFLRRLRYKESFWPPFRSALQAYYRIVLPLLLIAALIEAFITPQILNSVIK